MEQFFILIQIPLKFVPKDANDKSALVKIRTSHLSGENPFLEPISTKTYGYMASLGNSELTCRHLVMPYGDKDVGQH